MTYVPAASTVYAACATDNVVDSANGGLPISGVSIGPYPEDNPQFNTVANITDAYDCCVACQTDSGDCGGYLYSTGSCMLVEYDGCSPDDFSTQFMTDPVVGDGLTIGNGPCGQILDGGPD